MQIYKFIAVLMLLLAASPAFAYTVHIHAPAVIINADQGILTTVYLNVTPGNGTVSVSVPNGIVGNTTVQSADTAVAYAASYLNIDQKSYNFNFTITDASANISGPSAGLAFTLLSIGGIDQRQLVSNFTVTGTINSNGTVGQIGGVYDKVQAAKSLNERFVLVPYAGNNTFEYELYYIAQQAAGIPVVEVSNVSQAIPYAFGDKGPSLLQINLTNNLRLSGLENAGSACLSCNQSQFGDVANLTFNITTYEIGLINQSRFGSVKSQLLSQLSQYRQLAAKGYLYTAADFAFLEFPTAFTFANYNLSNSSSAGVLVQNISQYCDELNYTPPMTATNYEYVIGGQARRAWALNALSSAESQLNTSQTSDDVILAIYGVAPAYSWCAATDFMYNVSSQTGGSPVAFRQSFEANVSRQIASVEAHYGDILPYVEAAKYDYNIGDYGAALYSVVYANVFYGNRSDLSYNQSTLRNITSLVNYTLGSAHGVWPTQFALESSFYLSEAEMPNASNSSRAGDLNSAYSIATLANQLSVANSQINGSFIAAPQQPYTNSTQITQLQNQINLVTGIMVITLILVLIIFVLLLLLFLRRRDQGSVK